MAPLCRLSFFTPKDPQTSWYGDVSVLRETELRELQIYNQNAATTLQAELARGTGSFPHGGIASTMTQVLQTRQRIKEGGLIGLEKDIL